MTRKIFLLLAVSALLILSSTVFAGKTRPETKAKLLKLAEERRTKPFKDLTAEEHLLMAYEREIFRLFDDMKLEESMEYLAEDTIVLPPDFEIVAGKKNQLAMFKQLLKMEGVEFAWEPIDAFVGDSKDMGYVTGVVQWKMPNSPEQFGKYISIWAKRNDKWMNKVEMRNTLPIK